MQGPCARWRLVGTWWSPVRVPHFQCQNHPGAWSALMWDNTQVQEWGNMWIFPCCATNAVPSGSGMYHQC